MSAAVKDLTTWLPQIFVFKGAHSSPRSLRNYDRPWFTGRGAVTKSAHFCTDSPRRRAHSAAIEPWRREDDRPEERKAQIIRAFRRALFAHGDCGKRPGFPCHSTRNGRRMAQAGGRCSTPFATHANANEVT